MSVCWTLFKSTSIRDHFDLDCILQKRICLNLLKLQVSWDGRLTTGIFLLKAHQ